MGQEIGKWTVMVYLAGDNDLDGAGVGDLKEMKKVGSSLVEELGKMHS